MVTYTEEATEAIDEAIASGTPLNVKELMGSLTLKNMLYNLFEDCDVDFTEFHYEMKEMLHQLNLKGNSLFGIRWLLPTKDRRLRKESYAYVKNNALRIIAEREQSTKTYDDLLSRLIKFYDENFQGEEARKSLEGDFIVYLIAGHDTTASTINALFMYLSLYPEVEKKVLAEMETVLAGKTIDYETANKLTYTKMVFQEALRLQSPLIGFNRVCEKEDQIAGFTIPAGTPMLLGYRAADRNPKYWDNPEAFEPERFREKRWGQDEQYAYLPFGGGPRVCIGMNFAYLEAMVTLAVLLPKYRLTLMSGRERKSLLEATNWPGGAEEMDGDSTVAYHSYIEHAVEKLFYLGRLRNKRIHRINGLY